MSSVDFGRPGPWRKLFAQALVLMDDLEQRAPGAIWTFGGGTVLMLRIAHRMSKDIDLFVPDPQYLGWVNPRLSELAESVSSDYEEAAEFIKLFLEEGEIDIVVGEPLTDNPWEAADLGGRSVKVETSAEIIAKKMWHRGDRAKSRDLYDLCAVADAEPAAIRRAGPFFKRHGAAFLSGLEARADVARIEFLEIDAIGRQSHFDACLQQARHLINPWIS